MKTAELTFEKVLEMLNLLDNSTMGLYLLENNKFRWCNKRFQEQTGYSLNELVGMTAMDIVSPDFRDFVREKAIKTLKKEIWGEYNYSINTKRRGIKWVKETVDSVPYSGGRAVLGFFMDISMLKEDIHALREEIIIDNLTGLYNQRHFANTLEQEILRSKRYDSPLSLIIFDIDHFKSYNDSFGHGEGDIALIRVAKSISDGVRNNIDSACRYGGEEFTVILPETLGSNALRIGDRIRKNVENITSLERQVTVSGGVAEFRKEEDTFESFFKRADSGLYEAKGTGRNKVIYQ